MKFSFYLAVFTIFLVTACANEKPDAKTTSQESSQELIGPVDNRIPVIFDTDANNELDDQHALYYLLRNEDVFDIKGITVNATKGGKEVQLHFDEAERIMKFAERRDKYPLLLGADANFKDIRTNLNQANFDGAAAVNFIIEHARAATPSARLTLLPVGKLTNIALALEKAPDIKDKVEIVWLGSNYPRGGEYNLDNDTASMNYVLAQDVPFEMVLVNPGKDAGSHLVKVSKEEIDQRMPGLGPKISPAVVGRHNGSFDNFGDYSVSLFEHIHYDQEPKNTRALFDLVAVTILKNPDWGTRREIPAPVYYDKQWHERPNNPRIITIWERFDKEAILADFWSVFE